MPDSVTVPVQAIFEIGISDFEFLAHPPD